MEIPVMSDFENKVAFITGAAHGQGRATALALAKEGADIVAFDVAKKIEYPAYSFGTSDELKRLKEVEDALSLRAMSETTKPSLMPLTELSPSLAR